jgi:Tfp pilus assembly protein FimT
MVVIVLIGIMTAVIVPEMRGTFDDAVLRSTSRDLLGVMNVAYSQSVSRNQPHRVRLDPNQGRFLLERRVRMGMEKTYVPQDVPGASGKLDQRVTIRILRSGDSPAVDASAESSDWSETAPEETVEGITFYPDGTADAAQLILQDRAGFRLALRINPVTARVRVIDLPRE